MEARKALYIEDSTIQPCAPRLGDNDSYPSGHTTVSRVFAGILDEIDPSRKALFDSRADQVAQDRVIGGVHHASDIVEGKRLGDELFQAFERSDGFQRDLGNLGRR